MNQNQKDQKARIQMMRDEVQLLELQARYWKAKVEVKEYSLKDDDLEKPYNEYLEREKQKQLEQQQRLIKVLEEKKMQADAAGQPAQVGDEILDDNPLVGTENLQDESSNQ